MEKLSKSNKCMGLEFGRKRSWIYFEIAVFYINILVLMLYLLSKLRAQGGGKKICRCISNKGADLEHMHNLIESAMKAIQSDEKNQIKVVDLSNEDEYQGILQELDEKIQE